MLAAVCNNEHFLSLPVMKECLFVISLHLTDVAKTSVGLGHVRAVLAEEANSNLEILLIEF